MAMTSVQAIKWLKDGATISVTPMSTWITRGGRTEKLHHSAFRYLLRAKFIKRVEPYDGEFHAVTTWIGAHT